MDKKTEQSEVDVNVSVYEFDRNRRQKKRFWRKVAIFLEVFLVLAIMIGVGGYFYLQHQLDQTMGNMVQIFGIDVSLMPVEDAAVKVQKEFQNGNITFEENGEELYKTSFASAGIALEQQKLINELERIKERQGSTKLFGEEWKNYSLDWELAVNEEQERALVSEENFSNGITREDSVDAFMYYDEDEGLYDITPDILGNRIDEEALFARMKEEIDKTLEKGPIGSDVTVHIDKDLYIPASVRADDEELTKKVKKLNKKIKKYLKSTVTYTFGKKTEEIDSDMIRSWMIVDGEDISLDEEQIWLYVDSIAAEYNTLYIPRYLESSLGGTVELSNNEYGYWIDTDTEFDQLIQDLKGGEHIEREPVYDSIGYNRDGVDDLCGNYIEISIEDQHLWMYQDGELITETDVVTGQPVGVNNKTKKKEDWSTCTGAYELAYKESPSVLSSDIYGYRVEVNYWMPFVLGQGLHDLASRSAFGGEIYKTNGSHGCVNLPLDQAAYIYDHIEEGYPILIY